MSSQKEGSLYEDKKRRHTSCFTSQNRKIKDSTVPYFEKNLNGENMNKENCECLYFAYISFPVLVKFSCFLSFHFVATCLINKPHVWLFAMSVCLSMSLCLPLDLPNLPVLSRHLPRHPPSPRPMNQKNSNITSRVLHSTTQNVVIFLVLLLFYAHVRKVVSRSQDLLYSLLLQPCNVYCRHFSSTLLL